MFKMEIILDKNKLENEGYNWNYTLNLLKENFQRAGFDRELLDDNRMLFSGTDSPKDFAYMGIMLKNLSREKWFVDNVLYWTWDEYDGGIKIKNDDCIPSAQRMFQRWIKIN